jgi:hypothetical protein
VINNGYQPGLVVSWWAMSIRSIGCIVVCLMLVLAAIGFLGFRDIHRLMQADVANHKVMMDRVLPGLRLENSFLRVLAGVRDLAVTSNSTLAVRLVVLRQQITDMDSAFTLFLFTTPESEKASIFFLQKDFLRFSFLVGHIVDLMSVGKQAEVLALVQGDLGQSAFRLNADFEAISGVADTAVYQFNFANPPLTKTIPLALVNILALIILISFVVGIWLAQFVAKSLGALEAKARPKKPPKADLSFDPVSMEGFRKVCHAAIDTAVAQAMDQFTGTVPSAEQILLKLAPLDKSLVELAANVKRHANFSRQWLKQSTLRPSSLLRDASTP